MWRLLRWRCRTIRPPTTIFETLPRWRSTGLQQFDYSPLWNEGVCERKITLNFLVISCISVFRGISGRSFLAKLDEVASPTLLKVTYYNNEGKPTMIHINLEEVKHIEVVIFKNLLSSPVVTEECSTWMHLKIWSENPFKVESALIKYFHKNEFFSISPQDTLVYLPTKRGEKYNPLYDCGFGVN